MTNSDDCRIDANGDAVLPTKSAPKKFVSEGCPTALLSIEDIRRLLEDYAPNKDDEEDASS